MKKLILGFFTFSAIFQASSALADSSCRSSYYCPSYQHCLDGQCVDANNANQCNNAHTCSPGDTCVNGVCEYGQGFMSALQRQDPPVPTWYDLNPYSPACDPGAGPNAPDDCSRNPTGPGCQHGG